MKVTLLKTDGKYYLYKKVMDGLKPNADYTEFTEMKFTMNELYLGSIISGVSVGYVTGIDGFEAAVQAVEEELNYLAEEELVYRVKEA
jgi:hypothetical protein